MRKTHVISTRFMMLPIEEVWDGDEGHLSYVSSPYLNSVLQENGLYYQTHLNVCVMVLCFALLILVSEVCKWSLAAAPAHLWPIQSPAVLVLLWISNTRPLCLIVLFSLLDSEDWYVFDCSQTSCLGPAL